MLGGAHPRHGAIASWVPLWAVWVACGSAGSAESPAGIQHPPWQYGYNARFDLNMHDAAVGTLLAVLHAYASAMKWVPAVMNFNFLPDMGRMTA